MILIIGGAYKEKLYYARSAYWLSESYIFACIDEIIDFSLRYIDPIERLLSNHKFT